MAGSSDAFSPEGGGLSTSSDPGLRRELDAAWREYQDELQNLADELSEEIERAYDAGGIHRQDIPYLIREETRAAGQLADNYYDTVRSLWQKHGVDLPGFEHPGTIDPDRTLYRVAGGSTKTDEPGLTFTELMNGQGHGLAIDDFWRIAASGSAHDGGAMSMEDWQQVAGDMIRQGARDRTQTLVRRDPAKPRYARVPRGAVTCAFCAMLAGRGFVYWTAQSAGLGSTYHRHCDCMIEPSFGKQELSGYDPDPYQRLYTAARSRLDAEHGAGNYSYKDILSVMRRIGGGMVTDAAPLAQDASDTLSDPTSWVGITPRSLRHLSARADDLEGLRSGFTRAQRSAVRRWKSGSFKRINAALFADGELPQDVAEEASALDSAIGQSRTIQQFSVSRYMRFDTFDVTSPEELLNKEAGEFSDVPGFMSTTLKKDGVDISHGQRDTAQEKMVVRILVPQNTHCLYLEGVKSDKGEGQLEILLPRGGRLEFLGAATDEKGDIIAYTRFREGVGKS